MQQVQYYTLVFVLASIPSAIALSAVIQSFLKFILIVPATNHGALVKTCQMQTFGPANRFEDLAKTERIAQLCELFS